jgi:RimJ/RimL family protein N-acetyltransferase
VTETSPTPGIVLRTIDPAAAAALLKGRTPADLQVAPDYPTEFSAGILPGAGGEAPLGPYFVHRADDGVVVGEIGGGFVDPGTVEIGYAVVASCWGLGYGTQAVRELIARARTVPEIDLVVGHATLERPASGRVLEKAGFTLDGERDDEHEGAVMRVQRWVFPLR